MAAETTRMHGIGLMAFLLFLSTLVAIPVLPRLSQELGARGAQIPAVLAAALATVVVVQFFAGALADRFSRRTLILVGAIIGSISSFLCAVAAHWFELLVLRVVGGIADAIAMPALLAITASLGADQPGRFFGILRGSQGMSFVVGPGLGSLLSLASLRAPFVVDGMLSLVAFLSALVLLRGGEKAASSHHIGVLRGLRRTLVSGRLYLYLLMGLSGLFAFGILASFVPTRAQLLGMSPWQIGLVLASGSLVYSLVSYVTGHLSDRCGRWPFVIASQVTIVIAIVGLIFSGNLGMLAGFYGLYSAGSAVTYLLCFVYAADLFDVAHMGTAMGAFDALLDLSLLIGPALALTAYHYFDAPWLVFAIAGVPALVALPTLTACLPRDA